jgi:diguanylate cyclase (GGDEF)-like protein
MAASDFQNTIHCSPGPRQCLSGTELDARLREEVNRAGRHNTALCCLLVSLNDLEELVRTHGETLPGEALAYLGAALGRELRLFDRIGRTAEDELVVVLPGADQPRGEIVARRALGRLHAVKIEVEGRRHPLRISVGIAAWREGLSAEQLLSQTRSAALRGQSLDSLEVRPSAESGTVSGEIPTTRPA